MHISRIPQSGSVLWLIIWWQTSSFLLLPSKGCSKVHANATNDWQYCNAKLAKKSEMYVKYGRAIYFWEKYKHRLLIKTTSTINDPKMGHFHDTFTNLYNNILVLTWILCMPWELWISGFVRHKQIMVTKYQPRATNFVLTWKNLISLMSHCLIYICIFCLSHIYLWLLYSYQNHPLSSVFCSIATLNTCSWVVKYQ